MYYINWDAEENVGVYTLENFTKRHANYITVSAYYVDSKSKLHFIANKKLKKGKRGFYRASFPLVKGQKHYVISQVNKEGKELGYVHIIQGGGWHHGFPGKDMKYNSSDWSIY